MLTFCGVCGSERSSTPCPACGSEPLAEGPPSEERAIAALQSARALAGGLLSTNGLDELTRGACSDTYWKMATGPRVSVSPPREYPNGTQSPALIEVTTEHLGVPAEMSQLLKAKARFASLASTYSRDGGSLYSRIAVQPGDDTNFLARLVAATWFAHTVEARTIQKAVRGGDDQPLLPALEACLVAFAPPRFSFNADLDAAAERWDGLPDHVGRRQGEFFTLVAVPPGVTITAALNEHPGWGSPGLFLVGSHPADWSVHSRDDVEAYVDDLVDRDRDQHWNAAATDLLGSWCLDSDGRPSFVTFVPEALCQKGILTRLVDHTLGRFDWMKRVAEQHADEAEAFRTGQFLA